MKAQTLIFEQVLLFMIAVGIFIVCFFLFQIYQQHYTFVAVNDQTKAVREMVSSQILELVRFEGMNASIKMKIPDRVSGELYEVEIGGGDITVRTGITNTNASSHLYQLDDKYVLSGVMSSRGGEIIIYKIGNNIILGEA